MDLYLLDSSDSDSEGIGDDDDLVVLWMLDFGFDELFRRSRHVLAANLIHCSALHLLEHGTDSEYGAELRFDRNVFWALHESFHEIWNQRPLYSGRGRPRLSRRCLTSQEGLALTLRYLAKGSVQQDLCYFIGHPETTVSTYLLFGLTLLYAVVVDIHEARIAWPSVRRARELADMCSRRVPQLHGCFGFLDGKLSKCPRPGGGQNDSEQEAFYTGYYHMHATKELFTFLMDGTVAMATVNAPGTWHDARIFREAGVMTHLERYPADLFVCGDTAFAGNKPQLRRVLSETELQSKPPAERRRLQAMNGVLSGVRVASEWGIGALFRTFAILNKPIACRVRRGHVKILCVHLFNLRTRTMGVNQIRRVFEPC